MQQSPEPTVDDEWDRIRIALIVDGQRLTGTLSDTPAGRDLLAQLPLTLTMTDFGSVEKVAELPTSLSITGAPPGQHTGDLLVEIEHVGD
ncbi:MULTISPECIES: cyclophilin-like fold protein [Rhodococcus]|uniref:cyclophilin-like fold protein n=1 Tax=Rhodococcus TaxID=1827 RepID=UPI00193B5C3B|nr:MULTISPECIES: cyclophilin-like fold protein [Rhodococcus]QRI77905.1 hypothetical protein JQ505_09390 [Rhodococcus aetherivorans]QSE61321.1 hypothetical protein JYA75_10500 [Rhodococcus sp. PSBB066]QSE67368.1 hypothetical protein JYA91_17090 [Rhodococcus sp. PSBB049]